MDIQGFIRCLREFSEFMSEFSFKDPENSLGDWRAVKQELKNGDVQGLIYRRSTEINIIYSEYAEKEIEMYVKMQKQFDPLFDEALGTYCKINNLPYPNQSNVAFTIYFNTLREFEIFIYQNLLPLGEV